MRVYSIMRCQRSFAKHRRKWSHLLFIFNAARFKHVMTHNGETSAWNPYGNIRGVFRKMMFKKKKRPCQKLNITTQKSLGYIFTFLLIFFSVALTPVPFPISSSISLCFCDRRTTWKLETKWMDFNPELWTKAFLKMFSTLDALSFVSSMISLKLV